MNANAPKRTYYCLLIQRISFLLFLAICAYQPVYALESINELEWSSRIILIRASGESQEVLNALKKLNYEIQDRDIYWFVFIKERIETNYEGKIKENFYKDTLDTYFSDSEINVILIGKDGGIKQKGKHLDLHGIFDLIDTMPMRQMEMRKSN